MLGLRHDYMTLPWCLTGGDYRGDVNNVHANRYTLSIQDAQIRGPYMIFAWYIWDTYRQYSTRRSYMIQQDSFRDLMWYFPR